MILTILIFLLILAILIFVHELGHFVMAKLFSIRVDEFALGFPPRLLSRKFGETEYSLNAIPLGGYVKIFGESGEVGERSFANTSKWKQIIVLLAGVSMNIIFGWLLLSSGYLIGQPTSADNISATQTLSNVQLTIVDVLAGSPADKAGLAAGDTIQNFTSADSFSQFVESQTGPFNLQYETPDKVNHAVSLTPIAGIAPDHVAIGVDMDEIGTLHLPIGQALVQGAKDTLTFLEEIVTGLWQLLVTFVHPSTTVSALSQVSGPVGIEQVVGQARSIGFGYLLSLIAFISLNLAVINLVPIPALDGGRIFLVIIEGIIRRPINPKTLQRAINISFVTLLVLIAIVTVHDIYNLL